MPSSPNGEVRSRLGSRQEKANIVSLNLDVTDAPKDDTLSPDMHRIQRAYKKLKVTNMYLNNYKGRASSVVRATNNEQGPSNAIEQSIQDVSK